MALDKRFAIIDSNGRARYPYKATSGENKGRFILRTNAGVRRSLPVETIEEAIIGVVLNEFKLRVKTDDEGKPMEDQFPFETRERRWAIEFIQRWHIWSLMLT